ncbi:hypothetical protein LguiA_014919 [Lonicera macranthoides]
MAMQGRANLGYYKFEGVEHYMNGYTKGNGHLKLVEFRERRNKDCGCLGFFYRESPQSARWPLTPSSLLPYNSYE